LKEEEEAEEEEAEEEEEVALNSEMLCNSNLFLSTRYSGESHIFLYLPVANGYWRQKSWPLAVNQ